MPPNLAVNGDMGWFMPQHRQWLCIARMWCKLVNMDDTRLTKKVFKACLSESLVKCKTWCYRVHLFFTEIDHGHICQDHHVNIRTVLGSINVSLKLYYDKQWQDKLSYEYAVRGQLAGRNKLRTYRNFKHSYSTEQYLCIINQKKYRSAYAKFRCGVAPLKIETGRYGVNRLPVNERLCDNCNVLEDEFHVLLKCTLYDDIRNVLFDEICNITSNFLDLTMQEQFLEIMSNPRYYRIAAKVMYTILTRRHYAIYR